MAESVEVPRPGGGFPHPRAACQQAVAGASGLTIMYVRDSMTDGEGVIMQSGSPSSFSNAAKAIATTVVVLAVSGSAALSVASAQEDGSQSAARHTAGPPAGLWRMDGYGTVLSVERDRVQEYQTTDVRCLKGTSAERVGGHGGTARYATDDGTTFTLRRAGNGSRASMRWEHSPGLRKLERIEALPGTCARELPKDPVGTFDVFRQTFDGTGIPPHIGEPVFTGEEFVHDRDSAFDRARSELR